MPSETLKYLIVAFIVAEMYSDKYKHLVEDKSDSEKDALIDMLAGPMHAECHEYFISGGCGCLLIGEFGNISINNIINFKPQEASQYRAENSYTVLTVNFDDFVKSLQ